jgi:hypothetical protein
MRVDRVDAAMAIRPYMVLALKREFLSSGFDTGALGTLSAMLPLSTRTELVQLKRQAL